VRIIAATNRNLEKAVSDGAQSLTFSDFRRMMADLRPYMDLWRQARAAEYATA
jgi:3-deoxy-D-arabino-heptulosonate 7-phosphate (DAHP) synthase